MPAMNVNDATFEDEVLNQQGTVLVDFHATWCGPCRTMAPIVDELATELQGRARVVKANVDESSKAAARFRVNSIPAFLVVRDGEVQQQLVGAVPKGQLHSAVEPYLN